MKVHNVNLAGNTCTFNGKNSKIQKAYKRDERFEPNSQIPNNKLASAMRATILVPLIVGSLSACEKEDCERFSHINPPTYSDTLHIHRFPAIKIKNTTFSEQSVYINKSLNPHSKVNESLNEIFDVLGIPKKTEGAFPVNMFWAQGNNIFHMLMDGSQSNDEKFVYNLSKINEKSGIINNFVLDFEPKGEGLSINVKDYDKTVNFNTVCKDDTLTLFKNTDKVSEKFATFKKEIIAEPNGKKKHSIEQTTFGEDTTRVNLDNYILWNVSND